MDNEGLFIVGEVGTDIYASDGTLLGSLSQLVADVLQLPLVGERLSVEAHNHPEREHVKAFTFGLAIPQLGYHIMRADTGDLYLVETLEIWGDFAWNQTEVPLTLTRLGSRVYGAGEAPIAGHPAVWVGTTDLENSTTKISWQSKQMNQSLPTRREEQAMAFSGLLSLLAPSAPLSSTSAVHNEMEDSQLDNLRFTAPEGRHDNDK